MYTKIFSFIQDRPLAYAESTQKFWDDEHISKYMLAAHLNPDLESASRQHKFIKSSAEWIAELAMNPQGKNLLDLGCGPGIYAEAFHDIGFHVTGIDFAKRSIEYASQSACRGKKEIHYLYQDYLTIDYENQFDVITLIYCDFGVLPPLARAKLLCKIKKALKPGGMLILDGFTAQQYNDCWETQSVDYSSGAFWNENPYLCIKRNLRYDEIKTYLEQYIIITEASCHCYYLWNKAFDKISFTKELQDAGFTAFNFYDNVCGKTISDDSQTICIIAR